MEIVRMTVENVNKIYYKVGPGGGTEIRMLRDRVVLHLSDGSKRLLSDGGDCWQGYAEALPFPEQSEKLHPVALLNFSAFTPLEGTINQRKASHDECARLIEANGYVSAVGHQATAQAFSEMFGIECSVARINFEQQIGQEAIVFRLKERQPEGAILSREAIEQIGYDLLIMSRSA